MVAPLELRTLEAISQKDDEFNDNDTLNILAEVPPGHIGLTKDLIPNNAGIMANNQSTFLSQEVSEDVTPFL